MTPLERHARDMPAHKHSEEEPKRKTSLLVRAIQATFGLGVVAFAAAELFLTSPQSQLRFQYTGKPISNGEYQALATNGWETQSIELLDGTNLRGIVRPPSDPNASWILLFSGNSDQYLEGAKDILEFVGVGGDTEMGLASWAYRGFDGSEGQLSSENMRLDASEIFEQLKRHYALNSERIHVVGFSLGSHAAVAVTKELQKTGQRPGAVTLMAPFSVINVAPPGLFSRWAFADRYDTLALLDGMTTPIMIIHGEQDSVLPIEQSQLLVDALGENVGFIRVPRAGHGDLVHHEETLITVRGGLR